VRHVIVIGAGVAGTAAAIAARRRGARVTLVAAGTGASVLAGGALDDVPWEDADLAASPSDLSPEARAVLDTLDAYEVGSDRVMVAATTGLVRPARGIDRALLDLTPLGGKTVLVPDFAHGSWDAPSVARTWNDAPFCRARAVSFLPAPASLYLYTEEHSFTDADIAARHDEHRRLEWTAVRLREAMARASERIGAIVLPPWLGVARERATALGKALGVPCGEALGSLGGPSGARFEHARDRALEAAGVTVVFARATHVVGEAGAWRVALEAGETGAEPLEGHAVVLATGGVLGGGLAYTPNGAYIANALPGAPRPLLHLTCEATVTLGAFGRPLDETSSLFGAVPEAHAWPFVTAPLLEHAGVLVRDGCAVLGAEAGLYAAGEVSAGAPHTWLASLSRGAHAGEAAAKG